MPKFYVTVKEVHEVTYEVEAADEKEARTVLFHHGRVTHEQFLRYDGPPIVTPA